MSRPSLCGIDPGRLWVGTVRREHGATLVTTLLLLLTLTILGALALNTSRVDTRIVMNTLGPQEARQTAEMGLGWVQEQLRQQQTDWDALLSWPPDPNGWIPLADAALPPGVSIPPGVRVSFQDDNDLDNDPTQDTNGVILVRVRGASGNPTERDYAIETLEAAFQRPGFDTSYAQRGSDAGNTGVN
jgi:hypothetical protein